MMVVDLYQRVGGRVRVGYHFFLVFLYFVLSRSQSLYLGG